MASLPDYNSFYVAVFRGNTIPEDQFDRLAARADDKLRYYEREYTVTYEEREGDPSGYERQRLVCALADQMYATRIAAGGASTDEANGILRSISIGSISQSWDSVSAEKIVESAEQRYSSVLDEYADVYVGV